MPVWSRFWTPKISLKPSKQAHPFWVLPQMATKREKPCNNIEEGIHQAAANDESDGIICYSAYDGYPSSHEIDLEIGLSEIMVKADKVESNCRICHLGLESETEESGIPIKLGCSCKDDLADAHKQCAETWFKFKGNKTCEICGSTAKNVVTASESEVTEQLNETNGSNVPPALPTETRKFWQGHRVLNFLLASMVFAFIISWLFHFNIQN